MPAPTPELPRLLHFNHQLLGQAMALAAAHQGPGGPAFEPLVGPHLRHVIEHFEALLCPAERGVVDYDNRRRDRALERSPSLSLRRLAALQARLLACNAIDADTPLRVRLKAGLGGEFDFDHGSSFGRELAFVAGHAVHHYALLQAHCQQHGIATDAGFGLAPATVAHARNSSLSTPALEKENAPCSASVLAA